MKYCFHCKSFIKVKNPKQPNMFSNLELINTETNVLKLSYELFFWSIAAPTPTPMTIPHPIPMASQSDKLPNTTPNIAPIAPPRAIPIDAPKGNLLDLLVSLRFMLNKFRVKQTA
jgi:hypothetical protein